MKVEKLPDLMKKCEVKYTPDICIKDLFFLRIKQTRNESITLLYLAFTTHIE